MLMLQTNAAELTTILGESKVNKYSFSTKSRSGFKLVVIRYYLFQPQFSLVLCNEQTLLACYCMLVLSAS